MPVSVISNSNPLWALFSSINGKIIPCLWCLMLTSIFPSSLVALKAFDNKLKRILSNIEESIQIIFGIDSENLIWKSIFRYLASSSKWDVIFETISTNSTSRTWTLSSLNCIFLKSISSSIRRFNLFVLRWIILCLFVISLGRLIICLSVINDSKGFKISVKGVLNSCDILVKNWIFLVFNSSFCFRWLRSSSALLFSEILRIINL